MTNNDVRLRIDINADDKTFKLTDTTTYPVAANDYVVGVYQLLDADGDVLYKNVDYDTPEAVVSPDINYAVQEYADEFDLPLDTDSEIMKGKYTVGYKCNVPTTVTDTATTVNGTAPHTLEITMSSSEAAEIVKLGVFEVKGHATTALNQVYTISSMTYGSTTATFVVNEDVTTATGGGSETVTIFTSVNVYTVTKSFYYCYTAPEVDITMSIDCETPKITVTDNTNYSSATNHSIPMVVDSLDGDLTLVPPQTPNVTATTTTTTITSSGVSITELDVWTTVWQSYIETEVTWAVEAWSTSDTTKWYYITSTVQGSDSLNVQCNSCTCDLNTCLYNLYIRWINALANNPAIEFDLRIAIIKIITNWSMYKKAEACGDDTTIYCNNIKEILAANDCDCDFSTDSYPSQVLGSVTSSFVNKTHLVSGVPSSTLGKDTDVAISDNMHVYLKTGGAWVDTITIIGTGNSTYFVSGVPSVSVGDDDDLAFSDDLKVYKKISGAWTEQVDYTQVPTDNQKTWQFSVYINLATTGAANYRFSLNGDYTLKSIDATCNRASSTNVGNITFSSGSTFTTTYAMGNPSTGTSVDIYSTPTDLTGETAFNIDLSSVSSATGEYLFVFTFISI